MAPKRSTRRRGSRSNKPIVHQTYMNVSHTWVNGEGRRNTVVIRDGKGEKTVERFGPQGQVVAKQTRRLSTAEKQKILQGKFIPGLWRNCQC